MSAASASVVIRTIPLGPITAQLMWQQDLPTEEELTAHLPEAINSESKAMRSTVRRHEYLAARWLVGQILPDQRPLVRGPGGAPQWPAGIVGSISHKQGHVCAAIADEKVLAGIGIDLESVSKFNPGIRGKICNETEIELLGGNGSAQHRDMIRNFALAFAFKEAIYKTYYPTGKTQFWFEDAEIINVSIDQGIISAEMQKTVSPLAPKGHRATGYFRWLEHRDENFVLVGCAERATR